MAKILTLGLLCSFTAIAGLTLHPTIASAEDAPKPQIRKRAPIRVSPPPPVPEPESSDQGESAVAPVRAANRKRVAAPLPDPAPRSDSESERTDPVARVDRRNLGRAIKAQYYCSIETINTYFPPINGTSKGSPIKREFSLTKNDEGFIVIEGSSPLVETDKYELVAEGEWLKIVGRGPLVPSKDDKDSAGSPFPTEWTIYPKIHAQSGEFIAVKTTSITGLKTTTSTSGMCMGRV